MEQLILYVGATCPYCHKVLDFAHQNGISLKVIDVWQDDAAAHQMQRLSGKTQVPCLRMGDTVMLESDDIIRKLAELHLP